MAVKPAALAEPVDPIGPIYHDVLALLERLHRRLLDVIGSEFDRRGRLDLSPVQALLLYNIGDKQLTASELRKRGCYLGSNVSYNIKKLSEDGFIDQQRSRPDGRAFCISLTAKGREIHDVIAQLYASHMLSFTEDGQIDIDVLVEANKALVRLDRFWTDQIMYRL